MITKLHRCLLIVWIALLLAGCRGPAALDTQLQTGALEAQAVPFNAADWSHDPPQSTDEVIWGITAGPDGSLWFAANNGVWRYDGREWRVYSKDDGLPSFSVTAIAAAPDGELYAAACPGGVFRLVGEHWFMVDAGWPAALEEKCAWSMLAQAGGRLWLGIMNSRPGVNPGFGAVHSDGIRWETYTPEKADLGADLLVRTVGLGDSDVFKTAQDGSGALWFLTEAGLARLDGKTWQMVTNADLNSEERFWNMVSAGGSLWLGHSKGVIRYDGSGWTFYPRQNLAPLTAGADGAVWFASETELLRYAGGAWQTLGVPAGFAEARILSAAVAPDGALWLGTIQHGLYRYSPGGEPFTGR